LGGVVGAETIRAGSWRATARHPRASRPPPALLDEPPGLDGRVGTRCGAALDPGRPRPPFQPVRLVTSPESSPPLTTANRPAPARTVRAAAMPIGMRRSNRSVRAEQAGQTPARHHRLSATCRVLRAAHDQNPSPSRTRAPGRAGIVPGGPDDDRSPPVAVHPAKIVRCDKKKKMHTACMGEGGSLVTPRLPGPASVLRARPQQGRVHPPGSAKALGLVGPLHALQRCVQPRAQGPVSLRPVTPPSHTDPEKNVFSSPPLHYRNGGPWFSTGLAHRPPPGRCLRSSTTPTHR